MLFCFCVALFKLVKVDIKTSFFVDFNKKNRYNERMETTKCGFHNGQGWLA